MHGAASLLHRYKELLVSLPEDVHPLQRIEEITSRVLTGALQRTSNTTYTDLTSYYSRCFYYFLFKDKAAAAGVFFIHR